MNEAGPRKSDALFHVSEEPGIERFEPRPSEYTVEPVVWAVDGDRLRNYTNSTR